MGETEELKTETDHAWGKITKSSSKDGGTGYEVGFSSAEGDAQKVLDTLADMNRRAKAIAEGRES